MDKVTRQQIDAVRARVLLYGRLVQLSVSFPLCMRGMHHRMRQDHHLRHGARRQYGLFLKGIGLSLEEALAFFREEFTRKIDADKVKKLACKILP